MCPTDSRHGHAALRFAQHRHVLYLGKAGLLYRILLGKTLKENPTFEPRYLGEDDQASYDLLGDAFALTQIYGGSYAPDKVWSHAAGIDLGRTESEGLGRLYPY